jgi:hypothetical protein
MVAATARRGGGAGKKRRKRNIENGGIGIENENGVKRGVAAKRRIGGMASIMARHGKR